MVGALKTCFNQIGEYLFELKRESLVVSLFPQLKRFISLKKENLEYISGRRTSESFKQYFLQENDDFNEFLKDKSQEFTNEFFIQAEKSLEAAFDSLKKRLPKMDSIALLGGSIVISDSEDIQNLQRLKDQFSALYNDSELFKLQNELKGIKDKHILSKSYI